MDEDELLEGLKAVAHPMRLRILQALRDGECNVGELEEAAGIGQPTLSQQLAVLRKAGLVETRRQAKLVFYSLEPRALGALTACLAALAPDLPAGDPDGRQPAPGVANFARMAS